MIVFLSFPFQRGSPSLTPGRERPGSVALPLAAAGLCPTHCQDCQAPRVQGKGQILQSTVLNVSYSAVFVLLKETSWLSWLLLLIMKISVLEISDILVRIRILGSVPLTNGSRCGSVRPKYIRIWRTLVYLHYSSKIKSRKKLHNSKNQGFLTIFAW